MKKGRKKNIFLRLLGHYGGWLFWELAACMAWSGIEVYGNNTIGGVIDQLFSGSSVDYRGFLMLFAGLIAAGTLCIAVRTTASTVYGNTVLRAYRDSVVDKLYRLEYAWFDRHNSASVLNKVIGDMGEVGTMMEQAFPDTVDNTIALLIYSVYIIRMNFGMFLVMLITYPLIFSFASYLAKKMKRLKKGHLEKVDDMAVITQDAVSGILTLRSFSLEKLFLGRMHKAAEALVENEQKRVQVSNAALILRKTLQWIPNIICASYALFLVYHHTISVGQLVAFIMVLAKFVTAFVGMPFSLVDLQNGLASVQRIEEILESGEEQSGTETEGVKTETVIDFCDVHFSYPGRAEVLSGAELHVKQGEHIAIVGESGGGKSTCVSLLCGFYRPDRGKVCLFGRDLREWELKAARDLIAVVSQDIFLFPASIKENLSLGNREATLPMIQEACRKVELHDFIMSLPDQYETLVGERGALLSGGQKQRLSIARALLKNAPVLLLDEPTSSVDVDCEKQIGEALKELTAGKTCITIAHRLSTIKDCDRVLRLKGGILV